MCFLKSVLNVVLLLNPESSKTLWMDFWALSLVGVKSGVLVTACACLDNRSELSIRESKAILTMSKAAIAQLDKDEHPSLVKNNKR